MKKLSIIAAAALLSAAPAFADSAKVDSDPFASTQGEVGVALAIVAGAAVLVTLASTSDTD